MTMMSENIALTDFERFVLSIALPVIAMPAAPDGASDQELWDRGESWGFDISRGSDRVLADDAIRCGGLDYLKEDLV